MLEGELEKKKPTQLESNINHISSFSREICRKEKGGLRYFAHSHSTQPGKAKTGVKNYCSFYRPFAYNV